MFEEFDNAYEVQLDEYKDIVASIDSAYRELRVHRDNFYIYNDIYSKISGKKLTSRITYVGKNRDKIKKTERYYVWELPDVAESRPPIPKYKLVLDTPEEVQNFLNYINKEQKK